MGYRNEVSRVFMGCGSSLFIKFWGFLKKSRNFANYDYYNRFCEDREEGIVVDGPGCECPSPGFVQQSPPALY